MIIRNTFAGRSGVACRVAVLLGWFVLWPECPLTAAPPAQRDLMQKVLAVSDGEECFSRSHRLYSLVSRLTSEGLVMLIDEVARKPVSREREELRRMLFLRWVEMEPGRAFGHAWRECRDAEQWRDRRELLELLAGQWASQDPAAAAEHVGREDFRGMAELGDALHSRVAVVWAETDAPSAVRWFQEGTCGKPEGVGLSMIVNRVARQDPDAAVALLEKIPEGFAANLAVEGLMSEWVRKDLPEAREWAETLPEGRRRRTAFFIYVHHWLRVDAPAAGAYLLNRFPASDLRKELIREFAYEWAHRDPRAVLEWRNQVDDEALRDTILSDVRIVWSDNDPAGAARHALQLPDKAGRDPMLARCGMVWGEQDHEEALKFAGTMRNRSCFSTFTRGLVEGVALRDPESAAGIYDRYSDDGLAGPALAETIIRSWCGYDPAAAARWTMSLPDWMKQPGMRVLFECWSADEPERARVWKDAIVPQAW